MYVEVRQGQMLRQAPKKRGRASTGEGRGGGGERNRREGERARTESAPWQPCLASLSGFAPHLRAPALACQSAVGGGGRVQCRVPDNERSKSCQTREAVRGFEREGAGQRTCGEWHASALRMVRSAGQVSFWRPHTYFCKAGSTVMSDMAGPGYVARHPRRWLGCDARRAAAGRVLLWWSIAVLVRGLRRGRGAAASTYGGVDALRV